MKPFKLYLALFTSVLTLSSSAFAIDQVILKNGNIVEGKILSDVPNRHVDIQLVNGNKKRFQQSEVASLERDVPSNTDSHMRGSTSEIYLGAQLGLLMTLDSVPAGTKTTFFNWGVRGGINVAQLGDFAKLAVGLSFTHVEQTIGTVTAADNQVLAQLLFRKVADTGFYFGPEFGFELLSGSSTTSTSSLTASPFSFGLDAGYDYFFNSGFSIGPDVRYEHVSAPTYSYNGATVLTGASYSQLKIMLTGTLHF